MLTRSSILSIYDFVLTTFTSANVVAPEAGVSNPVVIASEKPVDRTFAVSLSMKSINLILNKDGGHLATASFDDGLISVLMQLDTMTVHGRLGNVLVVDHMTQSLPSDIFRNFMSMEGSQVADFTFETFSMTSEEYPGYDSSLSVRAPSLRMTHLEEFTKSLQVFVIVYISRPICLNFRDCISCWKVLEKLLMNLRLKYSLLLASFAMTLISRLLLSSFLSLRLHVLIR